MGILESGEAVPHAASAVGGWIGLGGVALGLGETRYPAPSLTGARLLGEEVGGGLALPIQSIGMSRFVGRGRGSWIRISAAPLTSCRPMSRPFEVAGRGGPDDRV
jgi:hypothetical protein